MQLEVKRLTLSPQVSKITFFVLDSPNNLLGRYGLHKLFPAQYNALRQATGATQHIPLKNPGPSVPQKPRTPIPCVYPNLKAASLADGNGIPIHSEAGTVCDQGVVSVHKPQDGDRQMAKPLAKAVWHDNKVDDFWDVPAKVSVQYNSEWPPLGQE